MKLYPKVSALEGPLGGSTPQIFVLVEHSVSKVCRVYLCSYLLGLDVVGDGGMEAYTSKLAARPKLLAVVPRLEGPLGGSTPQIFVLVEHSVSKAWQVYLCSYLLGLDVVGGGGMEAYTSKLAARPKLLAY